MDIIKKINDLKELNQNFCVATIVKIQGSTPGKVGFKYLIVENGDKFGTIGGGAIETKVFDECLNRIKLNESILKEYILTDAENFESQDAEVVKMMCSGKLWIYYEVFLAQKVVYVFGGGHVGKEVGYYLKPLKYKTILVDNRKEMATKEANPYFDEIIYSEYEDYCTNFVPPANSYFVILTHGHSFDYIVAKKIVERKIETKYIGIIASSIKAAKLKEMLKEEINRNLDLSNIYSPIGLKIGGDTASEIALSICAQIQSIVFNKNN
ncbi:MAG: XdhC/CoxI family protein [bacterium]